MSRSELTSEERAAGGDAGESLGSTTAVTRRDDAPRLEPWLGVSLLAIVPMLVAFVIPTEHVKFAAAIAGILLVIGLGMLVVQERRQ